MSLVVRIWLYSILLFAVVSTLLLVARFVLPHFRPPADMFIPHTILIIFTALVLVFVCVAWPLARSIGRPLAELAALTRALGAGDLGVRAPPGRRDEIGALGAAFNAMAAQIQHLRAAERQLLADVSHELRTPLARIRVVLELAGTADLAKVQRYHAEIATDMSELEQLLDDIIVSTRLESWDAAHPPLHLRAMTIGELVDAATSRFAERWPHRHLVCDAAPALTDAAIAGDPMVLRRALDNLVDNARKYSPDDAPIELAIAADPAGVRLTVRDHGDGIAAEDQPRVFTPFFRADKSRTRATGGVGLGLALTRGIVEAHGGAIGFATTPGAGSEFWLTLPVTAHGASTRPGMSATT
jgi:two-component system OmpR family sensor kinase